MDESRVPRMPLWVKLAFFLGDALLFGVALVIVLEAPRPLPLYHAVLLVISVMGGGILFTVPFLLEYKAALALAQIEELKPVTDQFHDLQKIHESIRQSTGQWQTVQEHCTKAVAAAKEVGDRMSTESQGFKEFLEKAHDAERTHLRLEVDKLRRSENEWLEVVVRISDHVYALYRAGVHSGQPALLEQLSLFQRAVRDTTRRVGLVAHEAQEGELFDERMHQLVDPNVAATPGAPIAETVATGYTMQGQPIRRIVVALKETGGSGGVSLPGGGQLTLMPDDPGQAPAGDSGSDVGQS